MDFGGCVRHTWGCSLDPFPEELVSLPVWDEPKVRLGSQSRLWYKLPCPVGLMTQQIRCG